MIDFIRNPAVEYVPPVLSTYPGRPCRVGTQALFGSTAAEWICLDQNMTFRAERYHGCYGGWFRVTATWDRYLGITALTNQSTIGGLQGWNAFQINYRSGCNQNGLLIFDITNNTVRATRPSVRLTILSILVQ